MSKQPSENNNLKQILLRIFQHVPAEKIRPLMNALAEETIEIITSPTTGLIMMSCEDCHKCEFYLGEILITEAEVKYKNVRGHGRIPGNEPEKALFLATVEAITQKGATHLIKRLKRLIHPLRKEVDEKLKKESQMAAATRVNFESMTEE